MQDRKTRPGSFRVPFLQGHKDRANQEPLPPPAIVRVHKEEDIMAYEPNPTDPYRSNPADAPYRAGSADDEYRRAARLDNELQPDPELAEGPASGGKIAMFAVAIALVLGAVFYGLNNTSVNHAGTSPTASTAQNTSPPAAPSGMRDVTPRPNTSPATTTGSAPASPPANNAAPSK
jgi:hypothetical protein